MYLLHSPTLAPPTQVITHLQSQRARQELLSMLYEVELRRHCETHRLLSTTNSQLEQWRGEREGGSYPLNHTLVETEKMGTRGSIVPRFIYQSSALINRRPHLLRLQ